MMNHISLFSGIGGFDLAAEWAGWNNVMQVEIDPFCRKVLQKNFPNVPKHDDIRTFNKDCVDGTVDIISGGFPCQPFSTAGKRLGREDERHLWPEMQRVIKELRPTWVVGENVPGIINMALEQVCLDLEDEGYAVWPLVIPACAVDAPHKRDRVWVLAYANGIRRQDEKEKYGKPIHNEEWNGTTEKQIRTKQQCGSCESSSILSNTGCQRFQLPGQKTIWEKRHVSQRYDRWAAQPSVGRVADGLQRRMDRHRPRLKAIGNAIVPQVAYELFTMIDEITNRERSECLK